jgi:hypothetical protein
MGTERNDTQRGEIEKWLDAALRARVEAEPRIGLEERVLARLATQEARRTFAWRPAFVAASAVMVIAIILLLHDAKPAKEVARTVPATGSVASILQPKSGEVLGTRNHEPAEHRLVNRREVRRGGMHREPSLAPAKVRELPMLATFPAPQPETPEEHLLRRFASSARPPTGLEAIDVTQLPTVSQFRIEPMEEASAEETPQE